MKYEFLLTNALFHFMTCVNSGVVWMETIIVFNDITTLGLFIIYLLTLGHLDYYYLKWGSVEERKTCTQ